MLNPVRQRMSLYCFTRKAITWVALGGCALVLTGCQSVLSAPSRSQVRFIDVSPDAPEIDLYQNSAAVAYKLNFGDITSYVAVDPGAYMTTATMSGTRQTLASSRAKFTTAGQYTVLIGDIASNLHEVTLKDQSQPAPAGQAALRFVDEATHGGPVDLYLIRAGQRFAEAKPVATDVVLGRNTGYLNVPAGTYTVMALPAGQTPEDDAEVSYSGAQVTYASGSASTVILMDQRSPQQQGQTIDAIIAPDYVPAAE